MKKWSFLFSFLFVFALIPFKAQAEDSKVPIFAPGKIIVKLKDQNVSTLSRSASDVSAQEALKDKYGADAIDYAFNSSKNKTYQNFSSRSAVTTSSKTSSLDNVYILNFDEDADIEAIVEEIKKDPNVEFAHPNYTMKLYNDPNFDSIMWHLGKGDVKEIRFNPITNEMHRGEGVVVAVIDSGINYNHPDLWPNVWVNPDVVSDVNQDGIINLDDVDDGDKNFTQAEIDANPGVFSCVGEGCSDDINDQLFHGSHVAGIVAGVDNGQGIVGVAPRARILAVKAVSDLGFTDDVSIANAIDFAAPRSDIINLSVGPIVRNEDPGIVETAILNAYYNHGCVIVQAAGNGDLLGRPDDVRFYAQMRIPETFTVAASVHNDSPEQTFSNFGAAVDIAAPGVDIYSLNAEGKAPEFFLAHGTSTSAPQVSGAIAMLMSHYPDANLGQEDLRAILKAGAVTMRDPFPIYEDRHFGRVRKNLTIAVGMGGPVGYGMIRTRGRVEGTIDILGVATGENFERYDLYYGIGVSDEPNNWTLIKSGAVDERVEDNPNTPEPFDGVLAADFDTTQLPEGNVHLRLVIHNTVTNHFFPEREFVAEYRSHVIAKDPAPPSRPDLVPQFIDISPASIDEGGVVTIKANVKNIGQLRSQPNGRVRIRVFGEFPSGAGTVKVERSKTFTLNALDPNEETSVTSPFTFDAQLARSGEYTIEVFADSTNATIEGAIGSPQEENNKITQAYVVNRTNQAPTVTQDLPDIRMPKTIPPPDDPDIFQPNNSRFVWYDFADRETPTEDLEVIISSTNPALLPNDGEALWNQISDGRALLTITPVLNVTGESMITITVRDEQGAEASSSFNVTVLERVEGKEEAVLVSPANQVLPGSTVTFRWEAGAQVDSYEIEIGNQVGDDSYLERTNVGNVLETTVEGLPTDGRTVWVMLYTIYVDGDQDFTSYLYRAVNTVPARAAMITPIPKEAEFIDPDNPNNSIIPDVISSPVTFTWNKGNLVTAYRLTVGNTGQGSEELYDSGVIEDVNDTSRTVELLLAGETVNVRLWSFLNDDWQWFDYTYDTRTRLAEMVSPQPREVNNPDVISSSETEFTWTQGNGVTKYWLLVGSTGPGSHDIFNSDEIDDVNDTSRTVHVPLRGTVINVRLYSFIEEEWRFVDYTYDTENGGAMIVLHSFTSDSTVTLAWGDARPDATHYALFVGTGQAGNSDIQRGPVVASDIQSQDVSGIPSGRRIYVRLFSWIGGAWAFTDYEFDSPGEPEVNIQMTLPPEGATITTRRPDLQWTTIGDVGDAEYWVYIGRDEGTNDIWSQKTGTDNFVTVGTDLPLEEGLVWIRVWWRFTDGNESWTEDKTFDFAYDMSPDPIDPEVQSPIDGDTIPSRFWSFAWTEGDYRISEYVLTIGTQGEGTADVFRSPNLTDRTSITVPNLPDLDEAGTLDMTLWWNIEGVWEFSHRVVDYDPTQGSTGPPVPLDPPFNAEYEFPATEVFQWEVPPALDGAFTHYALYVGTTKGNNDIFAGDVITEKEVLIGGIPQTGETVHVRLWYYLRNNGWYFDDYEFATQQ